MSKNTGMNAENAKTGKTAKLRSDKVKAINKKLVAEKGAPPPTKTVASVQKARDKKKKDGDSVLLTHKPV